ncbi:MAG: hypothetical protein VW270_02970 [Candidatus Poseidoniales archaeon]
MADFNDYTGRTVLSPYPERPTLLSRQVPRQNRKIEKPPWEKTGRFNITKLREKISGLNYLSKFYFDFPDLRSGNLKSDSLVREALKKVPSNFLENLYFYSENITIPMRGINTDPHVYANGFRFEAPIGTNYGDGDIAITMNLDKNYYLYDFFMAWMDQIHSRKTGYYSFHDRYVTDLYIYQLSNNDVEFPDNRTFADMIAEYENENNPNVYTGLIAYRVFLGNCYPKSVTALEFKHESSGERAKITVGFTYEKVDYWRPQPQIPPSQWYEPPVPLSGFQTGFDSNMSWAEIQELAAQMGEARDNYPESIREKQQAEWNEYFNETTFPITDYQSSSQPGGPGQTLEEFLNAQAEYKRELESKSFRTYLTSVKDAIQARLTDEYGGRPQYIIDTAANIQVENPDYYSPEDIERLAQEKLTELAISNLTDKTQADWDHRWAGADAIAEERFGAGNYYQNNETSPVLREQYGEQIMGGPRNLSIFGPDGPNTVDELADEMMALDPDVINLDFENANLPSDYRVNNLGSSPKSGTSGIQNEVQAGPNERIITSRNGNAVSLPIENAATQEEAMEAIQQAAIDYKKNNPGDDIDDYVQILVGEALEREQRQRANKVERTMQTNKAITAALDVSLRADGTPAMTLDDAIAQTSLDSNNASLARNLRLQNSQHPRADQIDIAMANHLSQQHFAVEMSPQQQALVAKRLSEKYGITVPPDLYSNSMLDYLNAAGSARPTDTDIRNYFAPRSDDDLYEEAQSLENSEDQVNEALQNQAYHRATHTAVRTALREEIREHSRQQGVTFGDTRRQPWQQKLWDLSYNPNITDEDLQNRARTEFVKHRAETDVNNMALETHWYNEAQDRVLIHYASGGRINSDSANIVYEKYDRRTSAQRVLIERLKNKMANDATPDNTTAVLLDGLNHQTELTDDEFEELVAEARNHLDN